MKRANPPQLKCPTCSKGIVWSTENPHRPFCSERCKLIDLGAWANEEHCIAGEPEMDELFSDQLH